MKTSDLTFSGLVRIHMEGVVDDKNHNEDFTHKVLLKPINYKLMIYIILVGGTAL
jgi:hypothetical protein